MKEEFLHYIWRFQKFDQNKLETTDGKPLAIFDTGHYNTDSGPDFKQAKLTIDGIKWAGNVEIHVKASDWLKHNHQSDEAYESVILHVVWIQDQIIKNANGEAIPTLELHDRSDKELENRYISLVRNLYPIPCKNYLPSIREITKLDMMEQALIHRLELKAQEILEIHRSQRKDWPQTCQIWLFRHFGFKVNAEPFTELGKRIPWKLFAWHQQNPFQIEALLFGVAGLLQSNSIDHEYYNSLKKEFTFLARKNKLEENNIEAEQWKFLRLRPANFPTLRMAQLAAFMANNPHPYTLLESFPDVKKLDDAFKNELSPFWKTHYHFGKTGKGIPKHMGKNSRDLLIINVAAPLMFAIGLEKEDQRYFDTALKWLEALSPEKNRITRNWEELGLPNNTAFDSQALIGLYRHFCETKQCLKCKIGNEALQS
jgi:hypothetical protein